MYSKFIGVVEYNKNDIWMSIRFKSLMKESLQVIFGKSDGKESWFATRWEAKEETSLKLS